MAMFITPASSVWAAGRHAVRPLSGVTGEMRLSRQANGCNRCRDIYEMKVE